MTKSKPVPPAVFDTPTLGRAVCLGELYDQHSGKFLGVQLYPQDKIKEVETNIRHTELTVSLSTTHNQKATLLDINAELSLDVLSGNVKVSGSASYLNDEKSNTNEYAYALALKMRLKEKRILFAEPELGRNVLSVAEKDYINTRLATHFVSSIVYGGNYIVNLVARQTEMSKEEKIEGKLQASFDKLKGAISLEGSIEAKLKGEFGNMDNKFDLVVHGDVALEKVPVTPKDVLDTFPEAASLITDEGGVPISVTLQPIPPDLYKGGLVYQIEDDLVDTVLVAFSNLDDLRCRFSVLQDNAKRLRDFVPKLTEAVRGATATYIVDQSKLLHELAVFLQKYKLGEKPDHDSLLEAVNDLYSSHLGLDDDRTTQYPSTLAGLEDELSRFQYFVTDIRTVRESLKRQQEGSNGSGDASVQGDNKQSGGNLMKHSFYLSSIEDVCRAIRTQNETLLFIMTPISGVSQYDLTILVYLAIVRKYAAYFEDFVNVAHMFYAEDPDVLKSRLDNDETFPDLTTPIVVAANVDDMGKLTWDNSPAVRPSSDPVYTFPLHHEPDENKFGALSLPMDAVDVSKSYSIHIRATEGATDVTSPSPYLILLLKSIGDGSEFLSFRKGFGVQLEFHNLYIGSNLNKKPGLNTAFTSTFVQDNLNEQWLLYLNGYEIAREPITPSDLADNGTTLKIAYPQAKQWWDGKLFEVSVFAHALTKDQVKDLASSNR